MPARRPPEPVFVFDLGRALAAFAVLAAHARTSLLRDAPQQARPGLLGEAFLGLTGLGHQAVAVFLVISGALITRSMLAMQTDRRWSASAFATHRLVRLWVVLIPCLLLGTIADHLTLAIGGAPFTGGLPPETVASRLGAGTLAGNLLFLQGQLIPTFGSNAPLWTLSLEAWCYAFGFSAFNWARRPTVARGVAILAVAGAATLVLGRTFWEFLPLWLVGSVLAFDRFGRRSTAPGPLRAISTAALLGAVLLLTRALPPRFELAGLYGLGVAAAFALRGGAGWRPRRSALAAVVGAGGAVSYSLYLSHAPLLALLSAEAGTPSRLPLGPTGLGLWAAAVALCLAQAVLVWWLFERHTPRVRDVVGRMVAARESRRSAVRRVA